MELIAEKRKVFGKKTKALKQVGKIPAVVFGKGMESQSLAVDYHDFVAVYRYAGDTGVIELKLDKEVEPVLVSEVQYHPVTSNVIHVAFHKVDLTKKISAHVPVEIIGEEENELIKSGQAIALTILNEVEVEALPADLPSAFTVDVANISEIGAVVTVADLEYNREKVEITGAESEDVVAKLDHAEMQEEEEEEVVSEEELIEGMEATEETAAEEGEEGSEEAPAAEAAESE